MLTAQLVESDFEGGYGFASGGGYGFAGGSAAVQTLQQQLLALSQAANWPAVHPGEITGTVTTQTIMALANVIPQLAGLDAKAKTALEFALKGAVAMGAVSPEFLAEAQKQVAQYATYISGAVGLLIMKYGKGSSPPPVTSTTPIGMRIVKSAIDIAVQSRASWITTRTPMGTWRVGVPKSQGLGGGLGAAYTEVNPSPTQPAGVPVVTTYAFDQKTGALPWYKNWHIMVPLGVGVAGAVGVGIWAWRR